MIFHGLSGLAAAYCFGRGRDALFGIQCRLIHPS